MSSPKAQSALAGRADFGSSATRSGSGAAVTYRTSPRPSTVPGASAIKQQREEETAVADAEAMEAILAALGFTPALVYEKRRQTWRLGNTEVVIDVLPFGLFMEIEGSEKEIARVEKLLEAEAVPAVMETYPALTAQLGRKRGAITEARFARSLRKRSLQ